MAPSEEIPCWPNDAMIAASLVPSPATVTGISATRLPSATAAAGYLGCDHLIIVRPAVRGSALAEPRTTDTSEGREPTPEA